MDAVGNEDGSRGTKNWKFDLHDYLPKLARERFRESREHVLVHTVRLLVPSIVAEAERRGDPKHAYGLAYDAMRVVSDLDLHLHPREEDADTQKRHRLWWHLPNRIILDPTSSDTRAIEKQGFELAVGDYLARPWMQHDHIDWCIVDALVAQEWIAFLCHVRTQRSMKRLLRVFQVPLMLAVFGLPLWGVYYLLVANSAWVLPALLLYGAVLLWELVSFVRRAIARLRNRVPSPSSLLQAMAEAYATLDGPALSPTRVQDALRAADSKGVSWPQTIWPVIEAAVTRNPNLWRVAPTA
jgi:hypothetical protein